MAYRPTPATRATAARRRTTLLRCAREIVAEAGFASASVKAIAERAGVSAGTVYTYFDSREELLAEVFNQAASVELQAVTSAVERATGVAGELGAVVETFARRALAAPTLAWALLIEPAGELIDTQRLLFRRRYADLTEAIVTRAITAGEVPDQDVRIVGPGLIGLISEALTGPLSPEGAVPHLIEGVTDMCLRAVGGNP